jgi:ubiquinone/menaquinone biosynthesis C-methylase UbiE
MNRDKYSFVAHRDLPVMNPIGGATVDHIIDIAALPRGGRVLDVGAGWCEFAMRLVERYGVSADCVERSAMLCEGARGRAKTRAPGGLLRIHQEDAAAFIATLSEASYDLTICTGSTHALGGLDTAAAKLTALTRYGGLVLLGEGYWRTPPSEAYLRASGIERGEFGAFAETLDRIAAVALRPLFVTSASEQEWDRYEWAHARAIESYCESQPDDPDAPRMLERSRGWRRAYVLGGRDHLGFMVALCRRVS